MKRFLLAGVVTALIAVAFSACSGDSSGGGSGVVLAPDSPLDKARLEAAWPVSFATADSLDSYLGDGWVQIAVKRNYRAAAQNEGIGLSRARAHSEAASLFRQAALVSTNSAIETYVVSPEPTDPVGAAHLVSIGYALNGDLEKARAASARLDGVSDVTTSWHAPWGTWLAGDATWPPDLSSLETGFGPPTPGVWPEIKGLPHYQLPILTDGDHAQPMGDPGTLVALALWHEAAAKIAAGDDAAVVDTYLARYRFVIEPATKGVELPEGFLYASDMLVAEDGPFMADLMGEAGLAAVEAHQGTSLTAYLASRSRGPNGKISAEAAIDIAAELRQAMLDLTVAKTDGKVENHHRSFADMARIGLLRNLSLIAELEDNREEGGKLRILAMEGSQGPTGCAVASMSLAAWDAGNRYPSRALEIILRSSKFYPSVDAARFGLDVLAIRVSRGSVQTPGF